MEKDPNQPLPAFQPPPYDQPQNFQQPPVQQPNMYPTIAQPQQTPIQQVPIQMAMTMASPSVGPLSCRMDCPYCHASILTRVENTYHPLAHLAAVTTCLLCLAACLCCLGFIPYCLASAKNANHFCPSCNALIGTYKSC